MPAFLTDPDNRYEPKPAVPGTPSTGRRLALAKWLTKPGSRPQALLARVLANRIWQDHFGVGLVSSSDNLGYTGAPPANPALLDYLAGALIRSGWSAKAMHRLILGSATWRQSAAPRPDARAVDPDNRLLARFPLRRLDAEALRDAMLACSGDLLERPGGPSVATQRTETGEVVATSTEGARRRSVYLQQRRTQIASMLEVFDAPSIVATCTRRLPATVPTQSLSLLNSEFVVSCARHLAERVDRECPAHDGEDSEALAAARLERAYLRAVGRPPDERERSAGLRFLQAQPARYPGVAASESGRRAWVDLCQMILASNAFLYVD